MRTRNILFLAVVAALVLGVASMAVGIEAPVLTATKLKVTFPHSASLVSSATAPSVIKRRLAGASDWVTFAPVPSGPATTTVVQPKSTAAYELVTDGVESDPVTISVAAQLSKPQIVGHGHRSHKSVVKGWVAPQHAGNVQLTFYRWEKVGTTVVTVAKGKGKGKSKTVGKYQWVQHGDSVNATLHRQNSRMSKWSYKWTPSAKGTWRIVVSHEDVAHVYSSASGKTVIKR